MLAKIIIAEYRRKIVILISSTAQTFMKVYTGKAASNVFAGFKMVKFYTDKNAVSGIMIRFLTFLVLCSLIHLFLNADHK